MCVRSRINAGFIALRESIPLWMSCYFIVNVLNGRILGGREWGRIEFTCYYAIVNIRKESVNKKRKEYVYGRRIL